MKLRTRRRSTRLQNYDYSQPGAYFVTICTYKKRFLFGQIVDGEVQLNKAGYLVQSIWESLPQTRIQRRRMLLPKVIGYFKMNTAKRVNKMHDMQGASLWQRNYYEHVIRSEDELLRTRKYILNNPARWFEDPDNPIHTS